MFAVTASAGDNGSISPGGTQMVAAGSAVTFNATPASGFQVNQWLVGGLPTQSGGSTYTLREVVTNSTIAVTFNLTNGAITNFTLLVKGHGSVSGYRAGQVMHMGRKYVIAAVPAKGSLFASWSSNGTVVATAPSYTFMAESNLLVQATFVTNPFIPVVDGLYHGLFYETNGLAGRQFRIICRHRGEFWSFQRQNSNRWSELCAEREILPCGRCGDYHPARKVAAHYDATAIGFRE